MSHDFLGLCECHRCPLNAAGLRRPVKGDGPDKAKVIVVGEAPGQQEARVGKPFIGPSGQLLDKVLQVAGTTRADTYVTNVVLCAPMGAGSKANKPAPAAISACSARLRAEIEAVDPSVVITAGATATAAIEPEFRNISEAQGGLMWKESVLGGPGRWTMATFHPAYILRNPTAFTALRNATKRAVDAALTGEFPPKTIEYDWTHISKDAPGAQQQASEVLEAIWRGEWGDTLSFDVETGSTNGRARLLQLALASEDKAVVIDAEVFKGGDEEEWLYQCFTESRLTWIGHNISFDLKHLFRNFSIHHTDIPNCFDSMMMALGSNEQGEFIGLKPLARTWFNAPYYEEEIHKYLKTKDTSFSVVPRPVLAKYAAADVIYTRRLWPILVREARRAGTYDLCAGLLTDAQKMFSDMEYDGVAVDLNQVKVLREEWTPKIREKLLAIQQWCYGHGWDNVIPINPNSPQQMEVFLYDINRLRAPDTRDLNSKGQRKRKTGKEWRELYADHPVWSELAQLLDEFKSASKLMSTYVDGIASRIDKRTGRVHPSFKPWGAVTGRITMEDPPLQTIPRKTTDDKFEFGSTRALFVARRRLPEAFGPQPPDLEWPEDDPIVFVAADYNALETRMMWFLSQDPVMGHDLLSGDFHRMTAARIFGIPPEQVTREQRHDSKYVTFGVGYGRDVYSLALGQFKKKGRTHAENLAEAQFFRDNWRRTYSVFWEWREAEWEQAQATGRMTTPFGRVRRFPLRFEQGTKEWKDLRNQAYNFPMQSTASDLNLLAATKINRDLRSASIGRALFIVHDSIEAEVRQSAIHDAVDIFHKHMLPLPPQMEMYPHPDNFVLEIELEVGPSWGEASPWK